MTTVLTFIIGTDAAVPIEYKETRLKGLYTRNKVKGTVHEK